MPRRQSGIRVLGPYPYRGKYRIFLCDPGGAKTAQIFATEKEANKVKAAIEGAFEKSSSRTTAEALTAYEEYLRNVKHNKPSSAKTTITRLRSFFEDQDLPLSSLTPKLCEGYYRNLTERVSPRTGKPPSVDSHRNILAEARTFLSWCVKPQQ
jgi:leucyl-tRNA synthetase